jgi:CubicO group peptidase (beta-lactamase class C family)
VSLTIDRTALEGRLDDARERRGTPGASIAVLTPAGVSTAASGILNLDTGVEATSDSLFQIGSITKVWTATLAMQLVDEGLLDLDVPIRTYLPGFRVADDEITDAVTTRHLLCHTSGIDGDHFADTGRGDDVLERYVESCATLRRVLPLGATTSYCNTGFGILGRMVEVLRGCTWDEALRRNIIEPLGLNHVATLPEDVLRFRSAIGHIQPPGHELQTAPAWGLPRSSGPAGAICATAADVVSFARLHLDDGRTAGGDRILSAESVRAMQTPQVAVPSGGRGPFSGHRGLGWGIYDWNGRAVVGHDGGTIGQYAFLRAVPDAGVAVALLTNGGNAVELFRELAADLLSETAGVEVPEPVVPPEPELDFDPSPYLGTYEREGASFEVVVRDGKLLAVETVVGLGSEMTPDPIELPLVLLEPGSDLFLTQHPALPDTWLPVTFLTLSDGSRCMHSGGRATPRVEA